MKAPTTTATTHFRDTFGGLPELFVRAPGRVNLIGEHIDYNQLTVLPMALSQSVHLWVQPVAGSVVDIVNIDSQFDRCRFVIDADVEPSSPGSWDNYVKAVARALSREFGPLRGLRAVLDSSLPVAAGLSSSSALVVAVAEAILAVNQESMAREPLALLLAQAERDVGLQGGGMDQTISLAGKRDRALAIDFNPLRYRKVRIPARWSFIVAFSGVRAQKNATAQHVYNERTHQCREAIAQVAALAGLDSAIDYPTLIEQESPERLLELATQLPDVLASRFIHVVSEAGRVGEAIEAMENGERETFGGLMNASHESLRQEYEVSTEPLDALVGFSREAGADGARLTGAGFGGSIVALAESSRAESICEYLREHYYQPRRRESDMNGLFIAEPSDGAETQWLEIDS